MHARPSVRCVFGRCATSDKQRDYLYARLSDKITRTQIRENPKTNPLAGSDSDYKLQSEEFGMRRRVEQ